MVGLQGGLLQSITSAYNFTLLLRESISLSHYYLQDHAKSPLSSLQHLPVLGN